VRPQPELLAVIPGRLASSRLPRKLMEKVGDLPMIIQVARRVRASLGEVLLAVDGPELADLARAHGFDVEITDPDLPSGTDRVWAALRQRRLRPERVLNIQGDQPLLPAEHIEALLRAAGRSPFATLACPYVGDPADPARVKVWLDAQGFAKDFSREWKDAGAMLHLGLYAFSAEALEAHCALTPGLRERAESLEQLRLFERGVPIAVEPVGAASPSVDTPHDLETLRRNLRVQG
jgi:3-deoxy-manno-octulosonate cytidylyltransferase (CMP-KDO synthetase)